MSIPTGGNSFAHELELNVRAELIQVETSQSQEETDGVPIEEWVPDTGSQRYEIRLRNLFGAVEALEDASGPADDSPRAEMSGRRKTGTFAPRSRDGYRD